MPGALVLKGRPLLTHHHSLPLHFLMVANSPQPNVQHPPEEEAEGDEEGDEEEEDSNSDTTTLQ